jgi:hypothetical protein
VTPPTLDDNLALSQRVEDLAIEEFVAQSREESLNISLLQGLPRSIQAVFAPTAVIHSSTACATNSGPLSNRM